MRKLLTVIMICVSICGCGQTSMQDKAINPKCYQVNGTGLIVYTIEHDGHKYTVFVGSNKVAAVEQK